MYAVNKHEEKCDKKKSIKIKVVSQKGAAPTTVFLICIKILISLWMLSSDVAGSIFTLDAVKRCCWFNFCTFEADNFGE